jgi:hypothetical protein
MEATIGAALVPAHDAHGPEAHLPVAANRLLVGCRRVDRDPVVAPLAEQEPGEQADRLCASALALVTAAEEDVDSRVAV